MKRTALWISVLFACFVGFCLSIQLLLDLVSGGSLWICGNTADAFGPSDWFLFNLFWDARSPFSHRVALITLTLMGLYASMLWIDRPLKLDDIRNKSARIRKPVLDSLRFGTPAEAISTCDQPPHKNGPEAIIARAILAEVSTGKDRASNAVRMELAGRRACGAERAKLNRGFWALKAFVPGAMMVGLFAATLDVGLAWVTWYPYPDDMFVEIVIRSFIRAVPVAVYGIGISLGCLTVYSLLSYQVNQIERGMRDFADELIAVCLVPTKRPKAKVEPGYVSAVAAKERKRWRKSTVNEAPAALSAVIGQPDEPKREPISLAGRSSYENMPLNCNPVNVRDSGWGSERLDSVLCGIVSRQCHNNVR